MSDEQFTAEETEALTAMEAEASEATPATPEAAPEPAETAKPVAEPEFKSTRTEENMVPHAAMHAERMKRQDLERRLEAIERERHEAQKPEVPQYVDPLEDPDGFRRYDEYSRNQIQSTLQEQKQSAQQQIAMRQRVTHAEQMEAAFTKTTPDYQQAAQFLHQNRVNELQAMGYGQAEVMQQLAQDANAIFDAGSRTGINPAQLVYLRAKEAGYQISAPVQDTTGEAAKMQATANAQAQTRGLGTAGGAAQTGKLTLAQMGDMTEEQIAKLSDEDFRLAAGG